MSAKKINWILLRGLSREVRHWGSFPEYLEQQNDQYKVFPLELPGVGQKNHMDSLPTLKGYVENLRVELQELKKNHEGEFGVIAISLGGMIALTWAGLYPDDFQHIVVLNSSGGNLSSPFKRLKPKAIKEITKLLGKSLTTKEDIYQREKAVLELTTNMIPVTDSLIKKWADIGQENPLRHKNFLKQLYAASKFKVPKMIKGNLFVISGAKDELCDPECSRILAERFKAPAAIHPQAGHDITLDDPEWLAQTIAQQIG